MDMHRQSYATVTKRGHSHTHHTGNSLTNGNTHDSPSLHIPSKKQCPFSAASLIHAAVPSPNFLPLNQLSPASMNVRSPEETTPLSSSLSPTLPQSPALSYKSCTSPPIHFQEESTSTSTLSSCTLNLGQLVPELLTHVFIYLEKKDRARAALTCSYFNQILKNKQIWKNAVARLNLRPNQPHMYHSLLERNVDRVQVLSLKRSLRELTSNIKLTTLRLSGCYNVTDSSLNSMQILPSLVELDLSLCKQITDAGLIHILCKAPNLKRLDLGGCCNLTDRATLLISYGLRSLKSLDLRSIYNITDKALSYLAGDVHLSDRHEIKTYNFLARIGLIECELCRRPSNASSKNRIELCKINEHSIFGMTCLESLVLQDCQKISDLSLQFIGRLKSLKSLNLSFLINISDNGLKCLNELAGLTDLNLRSCDNITDVGFVHLKDCRAIQHLDVSFCEKISSLNPTVCKMLKTLSLSACNIGDDALFTIPQMDQLQTLNLGQCPKLSDAGLVVISVKCPNLKYIDLYGCSRITTTGLKVLMDMPYLKHVNLGLWKV